MLGTFIDPSHALRLGQAAHEASISWLGLDCEEFLRCYDRSPFLVRHRLHQHPLFQRAALFELARRHPHSDVKLRTGKVPITEDFDRSFSHYGHGLALEDALKHFEERKAYLVINNPEKDPIYHDLIEALLGEVAASTARVDPGITWYSTYLFVSSRDAITPYHMDREMNFLFQIDGIKQVRLWDRQDSEVMTEAQKDELLAYATELRPPYKASNEPSACTFELRPGIGVHHPFIAPHVVSTGSDFSVSLAFTYRTRRTDMWTAAHHLNHKLRQHGWQPRPVGAIPLFDQAKASLMRLATNSRAAVRFIRRRLLR